MIQDPDERIAAAEEAVAAAPDLEALDRIRVQYLGKKGTLTAELKALGQLPPDERPAAGAAINRAKKRLAERIEASMSAGRARLPGGFETMIPGDGR